MFDEYASYHRDPVNRAAHAVGFPLIFTGLFGLTDQVGLGLVFFLLFGAMNIAIEWRLAVVAAVAAMPLWWVGAAMSVGWLVALLVIGVAVPISGHIWFERRWPDTAERFARFEAVGHLWFLNRAVGFVRPGGRSS